MKNENNPLKEKTKIREKAVEQTNLALTFIRIFVVGIVLFFLSLFVIKVCVDLTENGDNVIWNVAFLTFLFLWVLLIVMLSASIAIAKYYAKDTFAHYCAKKILEACIQTFAGILIAGIVGTGAYIILNL